MELSDELYDRIEELSETGNEAMESEDYAKAISCFQEALDILPEPKEDWEAYLWLVGSIGDAHFMMGNYGKSLEFFRKCYNIGETDNPFILLRLGENYLEMEDETNATEFLLRAYMQVMPLQSIWRNEASANHRILRLWRTRLSNVWCSVYGIWPRRFPLHYHRPSRFPTFPFRKPRTARTQVPLTTKKRPSAGK